MAALSRGSRVRRCRRYAALVAVIAGAALLADQNPANAATKSVPSAVGPPLTTAAPPATSAATGATAKPTPTSSPEEIAEVARRDAIAAEIAESGVYADAGTGVGRSDLAAVQRRLVQAGNPWGLVIFADEPADAKTMAADILDAARSDLGQIHTIVLLTPTQLAGASREYRDIDTALAEVLPTFERDPLTAYVELYGRLTGGELPRASADDGSPASSSAPARLVGIAGVALMLLALLSVAASSRRRRRLAEDPPAAS